MREVYPSDIKREQFKKIRLTLETFKKRTRPREVDLYDIFCGVLYVLRTGCQWRALPHDFPKWRTVYEYFRQWNNCKKEESESLLEQVLKKIGIRTS
jgi:transposase